jgi:hypothetical protein
MKEIQVLLVLWSMESIFLQGAVFLLLQVVSQVKWWILLFAPPIRYPHFDILCGLEAAHNRNSKLSCHELPYLTYETVLNKLVYLICQSFVLYENLNVRLMIVSKRLLMQKNEKLVGLNPRPPHHEFTTVTLHLSVIDDLIL